MVMSTLVLKEMSGLTMIRYSYKCEYCWHTWEEDRRVDEREIPTVLPCPKCHEYGVYKLIGSAGFSVPEGGVGNSANGYSSTHGDAEIFKAKSRGEKPPY